MEAKDSGLLPYRDKQQTAAYCKSLPIKAAKPKLKLRGGLRGRLATCLANTSIKQLPERNTFGG